MIILKFNLIHIYFWLIKNIYIPKLRFKGFDKKYKNVKLKDISTYKKGKDFSKKDLDDNGKNPIILYGDLFTQYTSIIKNINQFTNESGGYLSKKNTLLFPSSSTSLNDFFPCSAIDIENVILGSDINIFEFNINNSAMYFSYLFSTPYHLKNIFKLTEGSTINHLYGRYLESYNLMIPEINEQEKIAKFFSLLDLQVSLLENKLQLIEQKFEYFLNYLFNKKTFNGKKALTLLKEISVIIKGDQINSSKLKESGLYYYQNGGIEPSGWLDDFNRGKNTISINEGGSCGIVKWHDLPFWSGGHLYTLEIKNKILINNKYLYYLLKCNEKKITKLQKGSSLKNIQKKDLEKMNISYLTNINEQILIVKFLNVIEKQKELLRKKINFLIIKKKYFLTKIFI